MKVLVTEKLSEHKYKTPEGYLICVDAVLARTGKQSYMRSELFDTDDESEVDVDRRPEEVFSPETLASFENKPITKNHPDEDVNSENIKEYSVGFVRDVHKGYDNGQPVILGTLVIQDAETIKEIEDGEYTQLSCGYNCDVIDEENPQQKCIRGNHIALCEQGRAGNARIVDSKMKKDSNLSEVVKFLKQNLFNFDVYYNKINFDSMEEMRNAVELLRKYGYHYDIYNSNSIVVEDSKMKKDEMFALEELRKMRVGNYNGVDIYKIDSKFSTNPNTSKERFDTFEEVKKYIDNGFRNSVKDDQFFGGITESKLRQSKDFKLKELFKELDELKKLPISVKKENDIHDIKFEIEKRVKQIKNLPNDIQDEESTYTEITKELEKNYDNFVEKDLVDEQSDLSLLKEYFSERQPNKKMELRHKLREMNYKEGVSGVNSRELMWVELNGKKYEVKNLSFVKPLYSVKDSKLTLDQIINIYKVMNKKKTIDSNIYNSPTLKGIIFKSDKNLTNEKFIEFYDGDNIQKLDNNIYIAYSNNDRFHQELAKKYADDYYESFVFSIDGQGKINKNTRDLRKYSSYAPKLNILADRYFRYER